MKRTWWLLGAGLCAGSLVGAVNTNTDEPAQPVTHESEVMNALTKVTHIESQVIVNAPVDEVWKCWSTSEGAEKFFAQHADIEPVPGGKFEIWFSPDAPPGQRGAEGLKVLSVLPGEMISFEWSAPPKFTHARPQKTWVVVTLTAVDERHTNVRLVHLGWDEMKAKNPGHEAEWDEVRGYFENAWPYVLGNLQKAVEKNTNDDAAEKRSDS